MSEPARFPGPAVPNLAAQEPAREPLPSSELPTSIGAGVGQMLRAAREARNMSVTEAAQSLKLGPRQVEAIEAEDWASLPGNTMIRGFVRNYARVLGIDADLLMRGLDAAQLQRAAHLEVSAGTTASLPHSVSRRVERRDYLAVLAGLLLLGLAALAYFYIPKDLWQDKWRAMLERTPPPAAAPAAAPPVAPVAAAGESVTVVATPNATLLTDAGVGGHALKFSFARPAWVEVRDGRGQLIFSELGQAGSQREIGGQPPFSLVVGNSTYVTLEYQGKMVDLSQRTKGDVARLTVE
ncbi:MAG: helix-turn-helix domain-containing protein [Candidatus Accumulibacter sp.]|uniref:Helix-turn-helix domain-containing protein n=1 Tax=Candidatus Accumulibacter affinis TaxID=2954384 RepID=A0A935THY1_9PROT|nr:helix-turn-helix domain-containing protein [Candidatus Accumulibacter affinis]